MSEYDGTSEMKMSMKRGDSLFGSFATTGSDGLRTKLNLGLKINGPGLFALKPQLKLGLK
jgi:hypothetical protein